VASSTLWQPFLDDEEGVQTRWNGLPTVVLLPITRLWELPGQSCRDALGLELLDGKRCEVRRRDWDLDVARAIHRNLVRVPRWCLRPGVRHAMPWVSEYIRGDAAVCRLQPDGRLVFLPDGSESCLSYQPEQGVRIHRGTQAGRDAWASGGADEDEPDD